MLQAFIIVLREGFEAFLIVAITLTYLQKTGRRWLIPAVWWGIALSVLASGGLGYLLREGVHQSFWEGILGLVTIVLVGTLVIHMWRTASHLKKDMEKKLSDFSARKTTWAAILGVLFFTVVMITREGMETVILLIQVQEGRFVTGIFLGIAAAVFMAAVWVRWSYLINLKRFFQVTSIFLLLFLVQVGIYSVHEFSEAGILPNSEAIHIATEPFSPVGLYGKWFSLLMVAGCALWLLGAWLSDKIRQNRSEKFTPQPASR